MKRRTSFYYEAPYLYDDYVDNLTNYYNSDEEESE
jgi:hypothetical protein